MVTFALIAAIMAMDAWAAWSSWSVEQRHQVASLQDPAIISSLHMLMRGLWQSEIQVRNLGLSGSVHPFDQSQLPLLSSMEFSGTMRENEQGYLAIQWPSSFHTDPSKFPDAVRQSLGREGHSRVLPREQWPRLLQPMPQTWADLELCLAKLVEQLVLRAFPASSAKARACEAAADSTASKANTARAAKRLRQRERRKLCKRGFAGHALGCEPQMLEDVDIEEAITADKDALPVDSVDDAASERSVSTTAGCRSLSSNEVSDMSPTMETLSERVDTGDHGLRHGGRGLRGWGEMLSRHTADDDDGVSAERGCGWEEDEDARSTTLSSSSGRSGTSADDGQTQCSTGWRGPSASCIKGEPLSPVCMDDVIAKLEGSLEDLDIDRPIERQVSSSSVSSDLEPLHRHPQAKASATSACATPAHLWPSTPEPSPPQSPRMMPWYCPLWLPAEHMMPLL